MNECMLDDDGISSFANDYHYVARTECILTYGGSSLDIFLNYTVLVLDLLFCGFWLWFQRRRFRYDPTSHDRMAIAAVASLTFVFLYQIALCLALACSGISIVWCACFGWYLYKAKYAAAEYSVPSSAILVSTTRSNQGRREQAEVASELQEDQVTPTSALEPDADVVFAYEQSSPFPQNENVENQNPNLFMNFEIGLGILNLALIAYYAWSAEIITTVAHFCAILLGMLMAIAEEYCSCRSCFASLSSCLCCPHRQFLDNFLRPRDTQRPARPPNDDEVDAARHLSSDFPDDPLLSTTNSTTTADLFAPPTGSIRGGFFSSLTGTFNSSNSWVLSSFFQRISTQDRGGSDHDEETASAERD